MQGPALLDKIKLEQYVGEDIGLPTLRDIIAELKETGPRPPRELRYRQFS